MEKPVTTTYCPHDDDPTTCPPCNRHLRPVTDPYETLDRFPPEVRIAVYKTRCQECPIAIWPGDSIVVRGEEWVHEECR